MPLAFTSLYLLNMHIYRRLQIMYSKFEFKESLNHYVFQLTAKLSFDLKDFLSELDRGFRSAHKSR
jgi:hypothetical protein